MSEPYYCFYFWLKRKGLKLLCLDVDLPFKDVRITNTVKDLEGNPILYHTWFSREYGDKRGRHTDRIDRVFNTFETIGRNNNDSIVYKDKLFPIRNRI